MAQEPSGGLPAGGSARPTVHTEAGGHGPQAAWVAFPLQTWPQLTVEMPLLIEQLLCVTVPVHRNHPNIKQKKSC